MVWTTTNPISPRAMKLAASQAPATGSRGSQGGHGSGRGQGGHPAGTGFEPGFGAGSAVGTGAGLPSSARPKIDIGTGGRENS